MLTEQKVASLEDATEMVNLYRDALDRGIAWLKSGVR